jgi:hypothetical protein
MAQGERPSWRESSSASLASSHNVMVRRLVLRDNMSALACLRSAAMMHTGACVAPCALSRARRLKPSTNSRVSPTFTAVNGS